MENNLCNHKKQYGSFCGHCGKVIREKCPECGEMELIGRLVCESKVKEATNAQINHTEIFPWRILLVMLPILPLCLFLSDYIRPFFTKNSFYPDLINSVVFVFFCLLFSFWQKNAKNKANKKFLANFPAYAAILKKIEEIKNGE